MRRRALKGQNSQIIKTIPLGMSFSKEFDSDALSDKMTVFNSKIKTRGEKKGVDSCHETDLKRRLKRKLTSINYL